MFYFSACRVLAKKVVVFPICCRPDGPRNKAATAIRADIAEEGSDTSRAKRALITANFRLR